MTELTLENLVSELQKHVKPVTESLNKVETKLSKQESQITALTKRLDKVESGKFKPAKKAGGGDQEVTVKQTPAKRQPGKPGAMAYSQVVQLSPPVRDKEGLTAALEEEDKKKEEPGYKMKRFRDMDYSNKMAATADQVMRYEEGWTFGYTCLGLNPNGTDTDRERNRDEIMSRNGGKEPSEKELEWKMIDEFLRQDMGMDDIAVKRVHEETEKWFFEGDTSFLKFYSRDGVALIYSWANMMNRMAFERKVTRKLHVWCPPQLESRFFALKNLEWTYRNLMKKKHGHCMTRICYHDNTIYAQYKIKYEDEYEDIVEPATSKIPTVEFWRTNAHPRLNSRRGRGRGRGGIPRPASDAPVPQGRQRPDEAERGRGTFRGRAHRGHVPRPPPGMSLTEEAARRKNNSQRTDEGEAEDSDDGMDEGVDSANTAEVANVVSQLNSKAVFGGAGQFQLELSGDSTKKIKAGSKRGRPQTPGRVRSISTSQTKTMLSYFQSGEKKRSRSERDIDNDEAGYETRSQKKKVEIPTLTKIRAERPSPTKEELDTYISVAKKLHKNGTLEHLVGAGGSLGQARVIEKMKLSSIFQKEAEYYENRTDRIKAGEKDYDKTQLHIDSALFKAERKKCLKTLSDLNDHTLDTLAIDKTIETDESYETSEAETSEAETEDTETETEDAGTETEDGENSELEELEITIM